jgi:type IV pilus assembly protein PilQ
MIKLLTDPKQPILSKRGSAVSDARTSTIFIQDTPARLEEVRKMIKLIDVPVRQVMIEARFVSATDDFTQSVGAKLGYTGPAVGANAGFAVGGNTPTATRATVTTAGSNVNLPATSIMALSLFNPAATKVLNLELAASETDGTSKNIASPRVVTKDRVAATISSGTQIPYQQASSSGATTTAFIAATLSLGVTPQITPDDHINMLVNATQNSPGANLGGGSVPSISTKTVTTEVMVENGGTVVIGGVFTQDISDATNKVPLLGDVPVLGWLFKSNTKSNNKTELLIFITPKIVQDALNLH